MYNRNFHNKIGSDKIKLTFHSRDRGLERLGIKNERELRQLACNARNKGVNLDALTIDNYEKNGLTREQMWAFKRCFRTKNNSERIYYHKSFVFVFAGKNACTLKTVIELKDIRGEIMNYKTGNNIVETKITVYYPVLVIEFNQFKMTYYLKHDTLYGVRNFFFTPDYDDAGVFAANSEGVALTQLQEFKSYPNEERMVKDFVKAIKDYNSPSPAVNAPQYLDHYFSIICREEILTTTLLDNKHRISPN